MHLLTGLADNAQLTEITGSADSFQCDIHNKHGSKISIHAPTRGATKYDLADMRSMFESFDKVMAHNKNLGLLSSKVLQNLLSAYTQNEYLRGIKVSTLNNVTDVQQE